MYRYLDDIFKCEYSIIRNDDSVVIDLGDYGTIETFSIFKGVTLGFVDIKLYNPYDVFVENLNNNKRIIEINHCLEGRYAYNVDGDKIVYFGEGDLCISEYNLDKEVSNFPLGHYKGLEFFIDVEESSPDISKYLSDLDLDSLYDSLSSSKGYNLIKHNKEIDHVIGELYNTDNRIKLSYFKLKTLELLLFFSISKFEDFDSKYFTTSQVKIVEGVREFLVSNLDKKFTIDELSFRFGLSKTTLKECFKEVYGKPIFKYWKEYKLDYACRLIKNENYRISDVSSLVGYSSHSKFSKAFKEYVGCTPSEYKNL